MLAYVLRRLGHVLVTLIGISIIVFVSLHLTPGDPAAMLGGSQASDEEIAQLRKIYGLNQPLPVQYLSWAGRVLHGDFGISFRAGRPIGPDLAHAFPISVYLALGGLFLAVAIGIPAGVLAAVHRDRAIDLTVMGLSVAGMSMPVFWISLIMVLFFSLQLGWLPSSGWGEFRHFILPAVSISLASLALLARMTRSMMVEAMLEDFVRTARAKGAPDRSVQYKHALRSVLPPIVTAIGLRFGLLVGGAVITETVFSVPGLGRMVVQAVGARDFPTVQGGVLLIAAAVSIINLAVDLLHVFVDPRVRYT
ncbi:MAG: ABC transporter permease [Armatimonadetes bacterium]|nr:ABC transporter permease [Armatimonadota bacterium]